MNDNSNSAQQNKQGSSANQPVSNQQQMWPQQIPPQQIPQQQMPPQQAPQQIGQSMPKFQNIDPYCEASQRTLQVMTTSPQCD